MSHKDYSGEVSVRKILRDKAKKRKVFHVQTHGNTFTPLCNSQSRIDLHALVRRTKDGNYESAYDGKQVSADKICKRCVKSCNAQS